MYVYSPKKHGYTDSVLRGQERALNSTKICAEAPATYKYATYSSVSNKVLATGTGGWRETRMFSPSKALLSTNRGSLPPKHVKGSHSPKTHAIVHKEPHPQIHGIYPSITQKHVYGYK